MDDLGEELTANIVHPTLKNNADTQQCDEAGLTDRLSKDDNSESADKFYQYQTLIDATHKGSKNSRKVRKEKRREMRQVIRKLNLQIQAHEDAFGLDTGDKKAEVLKVRLDLWILNGVGRYGMCLDKLDQVIRKFARAGTLPQGYHYPELFQLNEMPTEL